MHGEFAQVYTVDNRPHQRRIKYLLLDQNNNDLFAEIFVCIRCAKRGLHHCISQMLSLVKPSHLPQRKTASILKWAGACNTGYAIGLR